MEKQIQKLVFGMVCGTALKETLGLWDLLGKRKVSDVLRIPLARRGEAGPPPSNSTRHPAESSQQVNHRQCSFRPALDKSTEELSVLHEKIRPIVGDAAFPASADLIREWLPRVSRFSFDVGRAVEATRYVTSQKTIVATT